MNDRVFLFPGQGSQAVGMGLDLFEKSDFAKKTFRRADEVLGYPLSRLCFSGPEEELKLTFNTQPALLTVSYILFTLLGKEPLLAAGHSLGEYSALLCAGVFRFEDALLLVHKRGKYMQEAVPVGKGAMAALIGAGIDDIRAVLDAVNRELADLPVDPDGVRRVVNLANWNSAGQVVISEPLAETLHLREGGTITLPTPSGPQPLTIAGVFYDYRTDGPSVWMDISLFRRFWHDTHLNAVRLYLKDPAKVPQVQARLQERYGDRYRLLALSHRDLRNGILKIFDETFALTYALEGVAVVVAVFGIITTFLVLIRERERDLALLQTIGASRRQILGMVLVESGLAGALSFGLGAACGSVLSLLLIFVINKQAFGWTIQLHMVPGIYVQTFCLVVGLGLAAAAYPAWRAMQPRLAALLKEE